MPNFGLVLSAVSALLVACQLVMLILHRRQQRLFHDLLFNTHVRWADRPDAWRYVPLTPWQERSLMGAAAAICVLGGVWLNGFHQLSHSAFFVALRQKHCIVAASWMNQRTTFREGGINRASTTTTTEAYVVSVTTYAPHTEATAQNVACLALQHLPEAHRASKLVVVLNQATRLGIVNLNRSDVYTHPPDEWRALGPGHCGALALASMPGRP